mgnify:CR=1 FL=1
MHIVFSIALLVLGFVLLIKGADVFVDGASTTAENFKVSKMLIGLTIIAFGTSAPEFAVSMSALASGSSDMVLGNVIGSCITNILLILGVAAIIRPIKIKDNTIKKELPLCMLISALLAVLLLDNVIGSGDNLVTRADAIVMLLFFAVFLYYLITLAKQSKENKETSKPKYGLMRSIIFVVLGLAGIVVGSELVVNSATDIAEAVGLSERVIALTIVASKKGEQELVVGNIIGSNIFNICVVLAVPVLIFGTVAAVSFSVLDLVMLVFSAVLLFAFSFTTKRVINRAEGAVLVLLFCAYYAAILIA